MSGKFIEIPELEEIAAAYDRRIWSEEENEILRKYYNRVPVSKLREHLNGKTKDMVYAQAERLGLTRKG